METFVYTNQMSWGPLSAMHAPPYVPRSRSALFVYVNPKTRTHVEEGVRASFPPARTCSRPDTAFGCRVWGQSLETSHILMFDSGGTIQMIVCVYTSFRIKYAKTSNMLFRNYQHNARLRGHRFGVGIIPAGI